MDLTPDTTVVFATMMFCSLATMAFGLWPALRLSRPDLQSSLKDHAGEISGRIAGRLTARDALVTAQLALSLAANLPVIFVKSFRAQHEGSAQVWILRAAAKMFLTLGLAGAFVAVIGLYGVRMAIGASPVDVLRLVVHESLATNTVGLTIGLGLAMLLGWGLRAAIYQISPLDLVTLAAATGILAVSSLLASVIPARRAANVLPMTALRNN